MDNFNLEEYFKDKINWKLIEYIQDISTKYADDGWEVIIAVGINSLYTTAYQYTTNPISQLTVEGEWWHDFNSDKIFSEITRLGKERIEYELIIKKLDESGIISRRLPFENLQTLRVKIQRKFKQYMVLGDTDVIIINK